MIWTLSQVALGGAIGAVARYLAMVGGLRAFGLHFPWATLAINVAGSFLIGVLFVWLEARGMLRVAPFAIAGVLGGFTTFSTFSLDALRLWERGEAGLALLYVAGSLTLSLAAVAAGVALARAVLT